MDRLILFAMPAAMRRRYGGELHDMLRTSRRPVADRVDLLLAGLGMRLGRTARVVVSVALLAAIGFGMSLLRAVEELRDGLLEIPAHWWSASLLAGFVGSVGIACVVTIAARRATSWTAAR